MKKKSIESRYTYGSAVRSTVRPTVPRVVSNDKKRNLAVRGLNSISTKFSPAKLGFSPFLFHHVYAALCRNFTGILTLWNRSEAKVEIFW